MAGQPLLQKLAALIEAEGGDAFILDRVADGEPVGRIARSIIIPGEDHPISRPFLYTWRNAGGDHREKGWALAMEVSAHALVEEAGEVLEALAGQVAPSSGEVALAKALSEYKRWLATKRNKAAYGEDKSTHINILNVGGDHLAALRELGHMGQGQLPESIPEAEAVVVDE